MPVFMMQRPSRPANTKGPSKPMSGYAGPVNRSEVAMTSKPSYGSYTKPVSSRKPVGPNPLISQPPQTTQPVGSRSIAKPANPGLPFISQPPMGGSFGGSWGSSRPWGGGGGVDLSELFLRRARDSVQPIFGQRI